MHTKVTLGTDCVLRIQKKQFSPNPSCVLRIQGSNLVKTPASFRCREEQLKVAKVEKITKYLD